ncbi:MAG: cation:proton antiporter [Paracoccaceae bacterium]
MTQAEALIVIGAVLLAGLAADMVGRATRLPRVTLLMVIGIAVGRPGLDLVSDAAIATFDWLATVALSLVAFLMGGSLEKRRLQSYGREIVIVSISVVVVSLVVIAVPLMLVGVPPELALVLGALACATDPAATRETLSGVAQKTGFGAKLEGIVAIDDAWGLVVFGLVMVAAKGITGDADWALLGDALYEIGGAVALGLAIGLPGAVLTGRIQPGEPLRSEALGIVFLTSGVALWLGVSFLLAAMTVGAVIANRARHHKFAFDEIDHFRWPFMVLFFVLAGASLDVAAFANLGMLGAAYIGLRIVARFLGGLLGGRLGHSPAIQARWFGAALLSQAGVAVGMALIAAQAFPQHAETILTLAIGATTVFELLGPLGVAIALRRVEASSSSGQGGL